MLVGGFAQNIQLLKDIPYEIVQKALTSSERIKVRKKEIVFEQGEHIDNFYISLSGILKLTKNINGKDVIHDIVTPNEIIGGLLMIGSIENYPVTLTSITKAELLMIPKTTYQQYWAGEIKLLHKLQQQNQKRMLSMQELRNCQNFAIEKKMAWIIKNYLKKINGSDTCVEIPISRKDLSELVGTTVETIIRVLSKWKESKTAEAINGKTFINIEHLNDILGPEKKEMTTFLS